MSPARGRAPSMKGLDPIVARLEAELDEKDRVREEALRGARDLVRLAGVVIRGRHPGGAGGEAPTAFSQETGSPVTRATGRWFSPSRSSLTSPQAPSATRSSYVFL